MIEKINLSDLSSSISAPNMNLVAAKAEYADTMYDRIMHQIGDFEKDLNKDEEVGAYLSFFGTEIIIQIEDVGYHNPYLIIFYGINTQDGSRVRLVQHVSQISLLFVAIKIKEKRKPNRIGFINDEEDSSTIENSC